MNKAIWSVLFVLIFGSLPIGLLGQQADFDNLDAYIANAVEMFEQTGVAVAIVKDSAVVFSKGYGFRNLEENMPMTTSALFNIASCSKAFTAACLGMLVDQDKLRWSDKVTDYIKGFRLEDPYITQQLNMTDILSHRSGLRTFYGDLLWYETDYSNSEIIHRMRYLPIMNDFRLQFGYQNNMFMIAGEIIEAITGKTWAEYLYDNIFKPLGMAQSRACSRHLTSDQQIAYPHLER
jgi:CubicO group peptidase (beta-lactamase class C family)